MSLQRQQAKEKKRQKRREEYSRYHAEQCWPKYRLLSRALPLLAWSLLKTHPLLPGNNSPTAGGMELGVCCCLKEYSSGPAMAPWSPADLEAPEPVTQGPKGTNAPCSADPNSQENREAQPKEERDVPTWSCSHPLLIEHLSLLVMDVRRSCSCMSTSVGDTREMKGRRHTAQERGHRAMPKGPGVGTCAEGTH
ncbi:hypothetical protein D4764_13G0002600 [Takifugu flavidus]|uniref:Uncharacterized protein n=1 Tax=Takifugu flavidus TaxID=433684 RepID=A0A5C6PA49_9TELE|nr:hypothetical protein D4764_13G0002600 [Takifugu flavidus]